MSVINFFRDLSAPLKLFAAFIGVQAVIWAYFAVTEKPTAVAPKTPTATDGTATPTTVKTTGDNSPAVGSVKGDFIFNPQPKKENKEGK